MGDITFALKNHQMVGFDTSIFIYHIEEVPRYSTAAAEAFDSLANGSILGVTSMLTLMEIVVRPLQMGRPEIADRYGVLLNAFPHLIIPNLDQFTARQAAEFRAAYGLKPAGALQVAACVQQGATAFLTNDKMLRRLVEVETLLLDDFVNDD
jgi:predicted nucleic acid-binding protein